MSTNKLKEEIQLSSDLRSFFYEKLSWFNERSTYPLPESMLFYSSEILDRYSSSVEFFEHQDGKTCNKTLGLKLLQASQESKEIQVREYKDIGDMALILCGYFFESINKKILSPSYYKNIGKSAYIKLNKINPKCLDIPHFYSLMADKFEILSQLLGKMALEAKSITDNQYVFDLFEPVSSNSEITVSRKNFKKAN